MTAEFGSLSLKMAGSLALVLGLIITLLYIVKRVRWSTLSYAGYPEMRLIGTLTLAPKRSIALIEICDQWLVVGIGTENVTLLSKFDPPEGHSPADDRGLKSGKGFYSFLQDRGVFQRREKMAERKGHA